MGDYKPQQPGDASGRPESVPCKTDLQMIEAAQSAFDARLRDTASALGNVIQMTGAPQDRVAYFDGLRRLMSSAAHVEQADEVNTQAHRIQEMIDAFGRATGRVLSGDQRALLEQGLQALAQINASERNRKDLNIIKSNIGLFIESLAQVLGKVFSVGESRMLTRALVRMVGDGSQNPGPA